MNDLFFSLGSNIEPRGFFLKSTILELNKSFKFVKSSSVYETSPQDELNQDNFFNICCFYQTTIDDPLAILEIIKNIETKMGRTYDNDRPKGPRCIDIDIIFFNNINYSSKELEIPHKSYLKRNFVIIPLLEIMKNLSKYQDVYKKLMHYLSKNIDQIVLKVGE